MNDEKLYFGFAEEDLPMLYEMLGILGLCALVIIVFIIPLQHLAFSSLNLLQNPSSLKTSQIPANASLMDKIKLTIDDAFDQYLESLRATLPKSLFMLVLFIAAMVVWLLM